MMEKSEKAGASMGRIEGAITGLFTKRATVTSARTIDDRFRLVDLEGDELRGVRWTPGDKVQVQLGGWTQRTYTPIRWDTIEGTTTILAYLHGDTPGCTWGRGLEPGTACTIFGPRSSVDLEALARPGLLFGDETSFGLAHSLRHTSGGSAGVAIVLEVGSTVSAGIVLDAMRVKDVDLVERRENDAHVPDREALIDRLVAVRKVRGAVLTGNARSIQSVNRQLRKAGLSSRQIRTRAYWALGKKGLD